jgi:hypothetical protein
MSTLEKEPPAAPGAGDLLDSLVQDHLQRAAAPRETPAEAAAALEASLLGASQPQLPATSIANQGAQRLQDEIASLLAGEPSASAPLEPASAAASNEAALTMDPFADFPDAAPPIEQVPSKPGDNPPTANVSSAELEMLLAPSSEAEPKEGGEPEEPSAAAEVAAELAADAAGPTQIEQPVAPSPDAADEVAAKLSEADGVMEQELAQLMTEKPPSAEPAKDASAAPASPMPPELAAAVNNIMNNPVQMSDKDAEAPAAAAAPEASVMPVQPASAVSLDAPASVAVPETAANIAAALDTLAESTPRPAPAPPNILVRAWRFVLGVIVMILQIIDMPFGWIKEPDKNVIGLWAFLLLLGGCVLFAVSRWMEHH